MRLTSRITKKLIKMRKFLLIVTALLVVSAVKSQTRDTTKNKSRKKIVVIEDTWRTKKQTKQKKSYREKSAIDTVKKSDVKKTGIKADTVKAANSKPEMKITDGWKSSKASTAAVSPGEFRKVYYSRSKRRFYGHWKGLELGFNTFINPDYSMYAPKYDGFMELDQVRSIAVNLNFWEWSIGLQSKRNTIGLVTGLGVEWNNYRFDNKFTIKTDDKDIIQPIEFENNWRVKKSKLASLYLNMPLLMEFHIPSGRYSRGHIAIGAVAGLRLLSYTKTKYKTEDDSRRSTDNDRFSLNNIRYSAMIRIGYGGFNCYATYGISKLFEKDKGPDLTPFTIGVTLINF